MQEKGVGMWGREGEAQGKEEIGTRTRWSRNISESGQNSRLIAQISFCKLFTLASTMHRAP